MRPAPLPPRPNGRAKSASLDHTGATRAQVLRMVLPEAALVGVLAVAPAAVAGLPGLVGAPFGALGTVGLTVDGAAANSLHAATLLLPPICIVLSAASVAGRGGRAVA